MKYKSSENKLDHKRDIKEKTNVSKANGFKWWLKNKTKKNKNKKGLEISENETKTNKNKNKIPFNNENFSNKVLIEIKQKHPSVHASMFEYLDTTKPKFSKKIKDICMISKIKLENNDFIEIQLFKNIFIKFEEKLLQTLRDKIIQLKTEESELVVFYDGGCNLNSNALAVCGITLSIVSNENTYPILEVSANLGQNSTNNTAEYMGLILSLVFVKILFHQKKFISFKLYSDSELVVRQMTGVYQVKKPHIAILYNIAESLLSKIKVDTNNVEIHHIRRSLNKEADKLANHAKDLQDNTLTLFY